MIADLKPYPEYKESGLPWLGHIPQHWGSQRAKWLFTKMDRPVREEDEVITCFRDGMVTLRKNRRLGVRDRSPEPLAGMRPVKQCAAATTCGSVWQHR